jgi:ABC-type multidrug transport system fused ATPase/permease subunit
MNFIQKGIENLKSIYLVSKDLDSKKKKQKILFSVILKNLIALTEVVIFICLAFLITGEVSEEKIINYVNIKAISNILPLLIVVRIVISYIEHLNSEYLAIATRESLIKSVTRKFYSTPNLSFTYVNYKKQEASQISAIYKIFISIIGTNLQLLIFLVTLIYLDLQVFLILAATLTVLFFPVKKLLGIFRDIARKATDYSIEIDQTLERVISNFYLIKILKKEDSEIEEYDRIYEKGISLAKRTAKLAFVRFHLFTTLITLLISVVLVQQFIEVNLTLEIAFLLLRGVQYFGEISRKYSDLLDKDHYVNRYINEMTNTAHDKKGKVIHNSENNEQVIAMAETVDFKYENSEIAIFENLNFSFERNSHNLILGPNGSGKSTLIGLMTGVFTPNEGTITINGSNFSYVGPVPLIFNDSLLANLSYGLEERNISQEVFLNYLEKYNVFDHINEKKLYDSVTHRSLSSGQMQKISFIRAFLRKPDVLFLDEAISNIDKLSINTIIGELNKFKGTIINITHNPEQFLSADKSFHIIDKQLIEDK